MLCNDFLLMRNLIAKRQVTSVPEENLVPLRVCPHRNLQLVSRQRALRNAGPLPPHLYRYRRYVLGQDRRAPCTQDLIQNIRRSGGSSQPPVSDGSNGVREVDGRSPGRSRANAVYPGGSRRSRVDRGTASDSDHFSDRVHPGPSHGRIRIRGGWRKV